MATLCASAIGAIRAALAEAAHGTRTAVVGRLAVLYGVSAATIYRAAASGRVRRPRAPSQAHYRDWVRIAVAIAARAPGEPVPLDIAIEAGLANGELPPEAAGLPLSSAYRIRRELGLHRRERRTQRLYADYPMQAVQFDASSSMYLSVVRQVEDGDWLLRLYRRPTSARGYKNKPLGPDRERPITYGMWDMCTGYRLATYCIARGEDALDSAEALVWMLAEKDDARLVCHGVPEDLWLDQGPLTKSRITTDLLERLDIHLVTGKAYDKTRMGGVERAWRILWERFERSLFLLERDRLLLSELNARLTEYLVRENDRRAARTQVSGRTVSRTAAFTALTNARPAERRLRRLPDNPLATLAAEAPRRLDRNGHLRWDGRLYEAPTLFDVWVTARRAPDLSGDVVIECAETGTREVATEVRRRAYRELRDAPALPLEQLLEAQAVTPGADIYAPAPGAPNLIALPSRTAPAAPLANPLELGGYADLDAAMRDFYGWYDRPTTAEQDRLIRQIITERGMTRAAVRDLACELTATATASM